MLKKHSETFVRIINNKTKSLTVSTDGIEDPNSFCALVKTASYEIDKHHGHIMPAIVHFNDDSIVYGFIVIEMPSNLEIQIMKVDYKLCHECLEKLVPDLDGTNEICIQCVSMNNHDWNKEPDAAFNRNGSRAW